MRWLHVSSEFPPARIYGLGRYVHDLAQAQARRGDTVHVLTNSISGRDQDVLVGSVHVHRINQPTAPEPPTGAAGVMIFNMLAIERFLQRRAEWGTFDAVISHDWLAVVAAESIRKSLKARWIHTMHDTVIGKTFGRLSDEDKFVAGLERHGCLSANAVVAVSRHVLEELVGPYEVPREKLHAVKAGVSDRWFQSVAPELLPDLRSALATPDQKIVTYVGRLDPEKGVDVLIEAFSGLLRRHPEARLVIAGKGTWDERLRQQAARPDLAERVRFLGYVTGGALEALYKVSDLLVCPSTYEPFGIVPLEGMINGLPVIASRTGGMAEIVEHGRSGLQVEPGNARELESALTLCLDNPGEARRLAEAGRHRARTVFNWDLVAESLGPIYAGTAPREAPAIHRGRVRLAAGIRVKDGEPWAEKCLRDLSEFADAIVIFDDGSTDRTLDICAGFPKVHQIVRSSRSYFHEGMDRNILLAMLRNLEPEWLLLPDIDEIFESRFKRDIGPMMDMKDVSLWLFLFCHFWRSTTHFRVDGKWGRETNNFPIPRLVRNQPGIHYPIDQALGSAQVRGVVGKALVSTIRVKHYGHEFESISKKKFELYSRLDPQGDYRHMIDEQGLQLEEWRE